METSQDVYKGIGKPWGGQTSAELHLDGHTHTRKRGLQGMDLYGTADDLTREGGGDPWVGEGSEVNVRRQKVYSIRDR
ncbi:hypothetical protein BDY19DRAFT_142282 [Irpex rosettiformis]|uniref:Uncharacterized protein n=1 Tax=Irpex rosettiformis TaxID=378272 RepID=A0ACB8U3D0_9APHY|nr:hypothetical protein BDY19DRAFT_142282 [Irpex rosettiformis]